MNFISHYYFDKNNNDSYQILGSVLPDLIRNADKDWKIFPEKTPTSNLNSRELQSIQQGWKKHLEVDRVFHNADFFLYHQHQLKKEIAPVFHGTAIKPFFIGHIGLELCLDHLLLKHQLIDINLFYSQLNQIDKNILCNFLSLNKIDDHTKFLKYYNSFISEQYLKTYIKPGSISYSIKRICMRIWPDTISHTQEDELTFAIKNYISKLEENFMIIFDKIESQLIDG